MRLSEKAEKNDSIFFFFLPFYGRYLYDYFYRNTMHVEIMELMVSLTAHATSTKTRTFGCLHLFAPCFERASHFTSYKNKFGIISHQTFHLCCHGMTGSFNAKCPQDQCAERHVRFINTKLSCHMYEDSQGKRFSYRGQTHFFLKHIEHYNLTFGLDPLGILDGEKKYLFHDWVLFWASIFQFTFGTIKIVQNISVYSIWAIEQIILANDYQNDWVMCSMLGCADRDENRYYNQLY